MDEVRQVGRGKVMNILEYKEEDFELNTEFDQEPVGLLKDRSEGWRVFSSSQSVFF